MAEFVNLQMERMLPEYEHMRSIGLFTETEIKDINKQREQFEYNIAKQTKIRTDFTNYITYERKLLSNIEERRKTRSLFEKRDQIEGMICRRIQMLYLKALERFPTSEGLWTAHVKFCTDTLQNPSEGSAVYRKMLTFFPNNPDVWIHAAEFEAKENDDIDKAREIMLRGMQFNPKSDICMRLINLELKQTTKLNPLDKKDKNSIDMIIERVTKIYQVNKTNMIEVDFRVDFLEVVQMYPCATSIERLIIKDLIGSFADKPETWDVMAKCCLNGKAGEIDDPPRTDVEISTVDALAMCVQQYELGCQKIPIPKMTSLYIDQMLSLNDKNDEVFSRKSKRKVLGDSFKFGHLCGNMSEKHYAIYLKLLMESKDIEHQYIQEVFSKAVLLHVGCKVIWELWIEYLVTKDDQNQLDEVFKRAIKKIPSESLSIWRMMMLHCQRLKESTKRVEELMNSAIKVAIPEISTYFKPRFIEYLFATGPLDKARLVYKKLAEDAVPCYELHKKMVELELLKLDPNPEEIRKCFEYQCKFFGKTQIEVWLEYIKFERNYGDPKLSSTIFTRAQNTLESVDLQNLFESSYRILDIQ